MARIFDGARREAKPIVDAELEGENVGDVMDFRMRSALSGSPRTGSEEGAKAPYPAIRKAMLLLEAKLGDTDVTHRVDEYEEPLVAAFQVLLAAYRASLSSPLARPASPLSEGELSFLRAMQEDADQLDPLPEDDQRSEFQKGVDRWLE